MTARGDFSEGDPAWAKVLNLVSHYNSTFTSPLDLALQVRVRELDPLEFTNDRQAHFGLNFFKLRAWQLEEYATAVVLDVDTIVTDIHAVTWDLIHLPPSVEFAGALDLDKTASSFDALGRLQGGVLFLRPCRAIEMHMLQMPTECTYLQYRSEWAEQSFLDWYWKFERLALPPGYNMLVHWVNQQGFALDGSAPPRIIHFTRRKLWSEADIERHEGASPWMRDYLCSKEELLALW